MAIPAKQLDLSSPPPIGATTPNTGRFTSLFVARADGAGSYVSIVPGVAPRFEFFGSGTAIDFFNITDGRSYLKLYPDIYGFPSLWVTSVTVNNGPNMPGSPDSNAVQFLGQSGRMQFVWRDFSGFAGVDGSSFRIYRRGFFDNPKSFSLDWAAPVTATSDRGWLFPDLDPAAGQLPWVESIASGIATIKYTIGLLWNAVTRTLSVTSTGDNTAISASASGTAAALTATNSNTALTSPVLTTTRSLATAGIADHSVFSRTGDAANGNGGRNRYQAWSSTNTVLNIGYDEWQASTSTNASWRGRRSFWVGDSASAAREGIRIDGNGSRAFVQIPSGASFAIGSTTDPGANNGLVAGTFRAGQFLLSALNAAPASATATGSLGEIRFASGFIYLCVAANTWQRAALTTW